MLRLSVEKITEAISERAVDMNTLPIGNLKLAVVGENLPPGVTMADFAERVRRLGFSVRHLWNSNNDCAIVYVIVSEKVLEDDRARKRYNDERGFVTNVVAPAEVDTCGLCGGLYRRGWGCCFDNGCQ